MDTQIKPIAATPSPATIAVTVSDATATVQKAAADVTKTVAETAAKAVVTPVKAARRGRPPKAVATTVKTTAKTVKATARKPKTARRAKAVRVPKVATATAKNERNFKVTTDTNNWFANLGNFSNLSALPGADRFQSLFADAGERGQEAVRRSNEVAGEFADIAKANVEAIVAAGRIAASGAQSLGQDVVARGREGVEQASNAVRSLAEAKSPTEFFQLQSELAKASFDRLVSEGSRLTESVVKLAGEAIQPLSNRASANAERINASLNA